ncbi:manganese efflux pump MntP [bioreactor metagenome]|uniref:Manganese efflux pump MntP n=1 Tax=bioreactor metagenome TaxID=1076179 RepID=A0A644SWX1_9ZZZZ|nr:manganese efflux pump [Negativicutes bacterium]
MTFIYVVLLGLAVSLDGFIAGIAYGLKDIRMPLLSVAIVGLVTTICAGAAMALANLLGAVINTQVAVTCGAALLILLGLFSLFQEYLTKGICSYQAEGEVTAKKLSFSIGRLVISIVAKPETADVDKSNNISPLESIFLGLALGLDNMLAAFAAALMGWLAPTAPLIMGAIQMIVISLGLWVSKRFMSEKVKKSVPYLPGALLILIGLLRLR